MSEPVIHWFRRDLRLTDNTALLAASRTGRPVIGLFIFDPALINSERYSPRRMAWMRAALRAMDRDMRALGGELWMRAGRPADELARVVQEHHAVAVFANADYSPYARKRDQAVALRLRTPVSYCADLLIHAPGSVIKADGTPYTVFTPFKRAWSALPASRPGGTVEAGIFLRDPQRADTLLAPAEGEQAHLERAPEASERAALRQLDAFVARGLADYADRRNLLPSYPFDAGTDFGTSGLSPYLRFGLISPRQSLEAARSMRDPAMGEGASRSADSWISELVWREFYMHILAAFPEVVHSSFRRELDGIQWLNDSHDFERWKAGQTGYPVVDAAMRQLNTVGWMHNRARMITASFLTKDLLVDWRLGERYFMQQLLDGDVASNNGGWQWSAGTGTDAQPYFRVFNPVLQSRKFDPEGAYIRRWVPELRDWHDGDIHAPWTAIDPPAGYPAPIVDHDFARARALATYGESTRI